MAGRLVWGEAYNGTFVGPTLRFTLGQEITVTLVNDLAVASDLDCHGLHISPSGHGRFQHLRGARSAL